MNQPTISIIVLYHEQPRDLAALLPALAENARYAHEILIIDDGSHAHPLDEISIRAALPHARTLRVPQNGGAILAMNRGLSEIDGDFVHFLASDDSVSPEFYAAARAALGRHPDAGLFCAGTMITEPDGTAIAPHSLPWPEAEDGFLDGPAAVSALHRTGSWFAGNSTVFSFSKLRDIDGFDADLEEFGDAFACYVLAARHGACIDPRPLAFKRDPVSGRGMSIYLDSAKSRRLCRCATELMRTRHSDLFPDAFVRRFARRWALNAKTTGLYTSNTRLAGQESLPWKAKMRFALHYFVFRILDCLTPPGPRRLG